MSAILSRLPVLFINYTSILRDLDNTKILLYKLFVRYLVVKPTCVNAALDNIFQYPYHINLLKLASLGL